MTDTEFNAVKAFLSAYRYTELDLRVRRAELTRLTARKEALILDLAARVPRAVPVPVADAPEALAAAVRAAVRRAQAEAPRMAEVQAEEDEYLGFV